jgi:2-methylcitrate dehydratase PrpD
MKGEDAMSMPIAGSGSTAASPHGGRMLEFLHGLGQDLHEGESVGASGGGPIAQARWALLDALGCGLLGARQPWGRIVADEVLADGSSGPASILGLRATVAPSQAALCNGTAMHGFELDDLLSAAIIHPGTVIVPAVLAAAQVAEAASPARTGDAPAPAGIALLRGIVAGYEATERISLALGTDPSNRGFHKTSIVGPVAGAIAASVTLGSSLQQLQWAVGLACSCAGGIKRFAAGGGAGMVKRLHAGRAAEAAVRMALLARRGFTAPLGAIDGKLGLLDVYAGATAKPAMLDHAMGERWALDDVWVKVYPICAWIQGAVQLLLQMRARDGIDASMVERVTVATSGFAVRHNGNTDIKDTMDAQYSIPYCSAVALTGDPMDPQEYAPERHADPARRALMAKVDLRVDPLADEVYPRQFACKVSLHLAGGRVLEEQTLDAHGTPGHPCTPQERVQKFTTLAALSGLGIDASRVIACVNELAAGRPVDALTQSLQPRD